MGALYFRDWTPLRLHAEALNGGVVDSLVRWDGRWYSSVARNGYNFTFGERCNTAFFPAYPLTARCLSSTLRLPISVSLLVVSNVTFVASIGVAFRWLRQREDRGNGSRSAMAMAALALYPMGLFFRMAYSESMFLLLELLVLVGVQRRWHPVVVAAIAGLASATRPVGLALFIPLAMQEWQRSERGFVLRGLRLTSLFVLSTWGLIAFCVWQGVSLGDPLVFMKAQAEWRVGPEISLQQKVFGLVCLKPVWSVYDQSSPSWWGQRPPGVDVLNFSAANPVFFILAIACVALGAWRRWLAPHEVLLGAALLLIPYVTRASEMGMMGMGRFTSVVLPIYPVLGELAVRMPVPIRFIVFAAAGALLCVYSAQFAAGYVVV
jgi:hypothetical protein